MKGPDMSHDNKALTRRWFDEVWNNRRIDVAGEMIHDDATAFGLAERGQAMTLDGFRSFFDRFVGAFPDLRIVVDDVIADGDRTACRLRATGTHAGPNLGVPPTGRPVEFSAIVWTRWQDGKIAQSWNEFDAWGLMGQISAGGAGARPVAKLKEDAR
jgi:steroid delta-isomerase-like uncharacterized protein